MIDLTTNVKSLSQTSNQRWSSTEWKKIEDISLTTADQNILLHPSARVTVTIIAGQRLLQKQTGTHGLQSPCLGQTCAFDVQEQDFILVVNNGHGHWLTIGRMGTAGCRGNIHDRVYGSVSSHVKNQIAAILCKYKNEIIINHIDALMQQRTCDCGAFTTCLANGHPPEKQVFDLEIIFETAW